MISGRYSMHACVQSIGCGEEIFEMFRGWGVAISINEGMEDKTTSELA